MTPGSVQWLSQVHRDAELEFWPGFLEESSHNPLYVMPSCILKQVQIRNVELNICHWHADHGWTLAGLIHHTQPHMQGFPGFPARINGPVLLAPVPLCSQLCRALGPLYWSLLSSLDSKDVGNRHFISLMFVSPVPCIVPDSSEGFKNVNWMHKWNFMEITLNMENWGAMGSPPWALNI